MKRTRLLLIAMGVLVAALPVAMSLRQPEVERNCAPAYLQIDFWQVRNAVLEDSDKGSSSVLGRFPFASGRLEVLAASRTSGPPFLEMLVLLQLTGAGDQGVYVASLTSTSGARWQLADWKHSTNLKRFEAMPPDTELAEAVQESGIGSGRVCSAELKRGLEKRQGQGGGCDPNLRQCSDSIEKGRKTFLRTGCPTCHTTDGTRATGPSLRDLTGRAVTFSDGSRIERDRVYLSESILDPTARIVSGFNPAMPSFRDRLNEEELVELLYYLESL